MNNSSVCPKIQPDTDLANTVKVAAILILGITGVLANLLIIIIGLKFTVRRNITYFVVNMAVADIFVSIYEIMATKYLKYFYINSQIELFDIILCKLFNFMGHSSKFVTLCNLLVITIERFRASRSSSVQLIQPYTKTKRTILIACTWIVPMILCGFGLFAIIKKKKTNQCSVDGLNIWRNVGNVVAIATFVVIATLALVSLRRMSVSPEIAAHLTPKQLKSRVKTCRRAVKMVLFSLLLYSTYYPFFIYKIWYILGLGRNRAARELICIDWEVLTFVISFLPLINLLFSPVVYLVFLRDYQRAAKKMLLWCAQRNNIRSQSSIDGSKTDLSKGKANLGHEFDETAL